MSVQYKYKYCYNCRKRNHCSCLVGIPTRTALYQANRVYAINKTNLKPVAHGLSILQRFVSTDKILIVGMYEKDDFIFVPELNHTPTREFLHAAEYCLDLNDKAVIKNRGHYSYEELISYIPENFLSVTETTLSNVSNIFWKYWMREERLSNL